MESFDEFFRRMTEEANGEEDVIFQPASEIIEFSSQYGSDNSVSYTAENLLGPPSVYPRSGDHAYSYQLRTYGLWWNTLPSYRKIKAILPHDCVAESQDFIEFRVERRVEPTEIRVFEVYNPGSVVKILCYCYETNRWVTIFKGEPENVASRSKCYMLEIRNICFLTDYFRLELHHKHLKYYSEYDGICLYGKDRFAVPIYRPSTNNQKKIPRRKSTRKVRKLKDNIDHSLSNFESLPLEVLRVILSYLDLQTLCAVSRVSRLFHKLCYDPVMYKELDLQLYWPLVDAVALSGLESRLTSLKKLNLSWCGGQGRISTPVFKDFIDCSGQHLTCLKLSSCPFVTGECLRAISIHCPQLQDLVLRSCRSPRLNASGVNPSGFIHIAQMSNLRYLDLYRTLIDKAAALAIVKSCAKLEHLFLGSCTNIDSCNEVARAVARNLKNIKSLDFWRATSLNCLGMYDIAETCHDLVELDLGWCHNINPCCGCIRHLVNHNRNLRKLCLAAIRTVSDIDVTTIASRCKKLEQLDILGTSEVTLPSIVTLLNSCKKLKLLDASYCDSTIKCAIPDLQEQFPGVQIKCSRPFNNQLVN